MESDIQDGLEDLGFDGALMEEGALTAAVQGEKLKSEFMTLCVWLVKEMKGLCNIQENVSEKEDEETFRMEMSGLLTEMGCPHSHLSGVEGLSTPSNRLLLLDYLTSELQAMRMIGGEEEEMEVEDQSVSPALQQILTILTALDMPQPTRESTVFELFSKIESKVRQLLTKGPKDHLGTPLLAKNPSPKQWSKLDEINTQLNQEYTLRRSMLLKRLDVTIQSFGWSDRAKVKKDEISAAFHPLRKSLSVRSPVSIPDIITARSDLLRLIKTSGAEMRGRTQCRINKIMMGKVPDRGGRPSNVAPPIEMPSFKKRTEAPRDQRSSHRDSGGRGGRGGKVQGGWNNSTGGEGGGGGGGGGGGKWRGRGGSGGGQRGNYTFEGANNYGT
ncbi:protein FAM98A-like [Montipora capricornis]|uniref:protein FAM98A-like n=1 Tax=Montipora capricornis TaxID=246305 RepID=UPI0035F2012D